MNGWFISSSLAFLRQRDTWEQSVPEPVTQVEGLCPDSLASVSIPPSMPSPEPPGSPSQYRSTSRGSSMGSVSSSQPYTLHPLEDAHYHPLTSSSSYPVPSSSFACPPYMSGPASDLVSKMVTEEADSHSSLPPNGEAQASWAKEDGVSSWSSYEIRRAYWLADGPEFQDLDEDGGFTDSYTMNSTSTWQYRENSGRCFVDRTILMHLQSIKLSILHPDLLGNSYLFVRKNEKKR